MKKLNKKIMNFYSAIAIAIICIFVSSYMLFKNVGGISLVFFLFGSMFATGFYLLRITLKRIMGAKVNV